MDKEGWTDNTMNSIDWTAHGTYLKTIPFNKKVNVVKMCHDWQFNKHRAAMFEESDDNLCPLICKEEEKKLHHLRCTKQPGATSITRDLADIKR